MARLGIDYYDKDFKPIKKSELNFNESYYEHCDFKDDRCHKQGRGWYDRCAWCKDNNGFTRKNEKRTNKPF